MPALRILPWKLLDEIPEYREQNKTVRAILRGYLSLAQERKAPTPEAICALLYKPNAVNPMSPVLVGLIMDDPMFYNLLDLALQAASARVDKQALLAESLVTSEIAEKVMSGTHIEELGDREAALLVKAAQRARARQEVKGMSARAPRNAGAATAAAQLAAKMEASNPVHLAQQEANHRPAPPR